MTNKKGFTLIEMVITIAMVIVLTTVFTASLVTYIGQSRVASDQVESHINKYDAAKASVAALRGIGVSAAPEPSVVPGNFLVTFVDWNGTVLTTQSVTSGGTALAPADPARAGYNFSGWSPSVLNNVTSDKTFTAQYSPISISVTFVNWDGTVLKTETVAYGGTATAPANPTRTGGYVFSGWNPSVLTNITSSITVTAQYATTPLTGASISGTLKKNYTQTATVTPSGATVTYQWQIASSAAGTYNNISGATAKTYKLPNNSTNAGKYIRVVVTGTGGYSGVVTSAGRGPIG